MRNPIITLLTDFGTKDYYVASMKGIILRINPRCTLIDITHQVKPHDIKEGAFILANAYSSFPKGTIHLCVVDPGVGGPRKPILLVTQNYFFVGPDNGLFTLALLREKVKRVIALTQSKYFPPRVSTTFHGKDIFAPVAGHLSLGIKPNAFGNEMDSWSAFPFQRPQVRGRRLEGEILHIDAFGNLVSDINQQTFIHFVKDHPFVIRAGMGIIQGLKEAYWEGRQGELMALFGSGGLLEISVREGNAQKVLKMKKGDSVSVSIVRRQ
jgi:S-adenosylmethionine hydrolase